MRSWPRLAIALTLPVAAATLLLSCASMAPAPAPAPAPAIAPRAALPQPERLSTRVVYASKGGCALDTNPMTGGGTDDWAKITQLLTTASELVIDGPAYISKPIVLSSNQTITFLPGSGLWVGQGCNGPALRNAHWVSSYNGGSPLYDGSTIVDSNITIRGPGFINGNRGNGTTGNTTSGNPRLAGTNSNGTPSGMYLGTVMFFGVKNLTIEDVTVYNPSCFHYWAANCFGVRYRNLTAHDPNVTYTSLPAGANTDGLHFNGPIDDVEIEGCTLTTADDGIAFNAGDGNLDSTDGGAAAFGGYSTVYGGPITRASITGIRYSPAMSCIRLLAGPYLIDQVTATGLSGSVYYHQIIAAPFGSIPTSGGSINRVNIDMDVDQIANQDGMLVLGGVVNDFRLTARRSSGSGTVMGPVLLNGTLNRIRLDLDTIDSGASAAGALVQLTGGSVGNLTVGGYWSRPGQSQGTNPVVSMTGGSATLVRFDGINIDNAGGLLSQTAGTLSAVNAANCRLTTRGSSTGISTTGTVASLSGTGNFGVTTSGTFTTNTLSSQ